MLNSQYRYIKRRYSEFENLYLNLKSKHRIIYEFREFPPKTIMHARQERLNKFHLFMKRILFIKPLPKDFITFLKPNPYDIITTNEFIKGGKNENENKIKANIYIHI